MRSRNSCFLEKTISKRCFTVTRRFFAALGVVLLVMGPIIGFYLFAPGMHKDSPMKEVSNLSTMNVHVTEVATTIATIRSSDGTNPPLASLGGINGTKPHIFGSINSTSPPNEGIRTNPPSRKEITCEKETMRLSCAANELIVIEDAFYGQREEGPHCGCMLKSCDQCEKSTTEKKESVTFGGEGKGLGQFRTLGGLTLSSTNKIFVTDTKNKRIQVFSMKGDFIRSFSTGNRKPFAVSTGRNDTLWVILEGARIHQYRKDGHATGTECSYTGIRGIAWHKVSDRIILTSSKKFMWLSPTDTPTQGTPSCTCNMKMFGSMGLDPLYVTVDKSGNIYITVWRGSRILKYDKNGVYVSSFGSKGSGAGNFYYPQGICVDSLGRVIVAHRCWQWPSGDVHS
ncbi:uncharacterized protein LOC144912396 [Branchiostoma floridae x Branchiostoma belcheri]